MKMKKHLLTIIVAIGSFGLTAQTWIQQTSGSVSNLQGVSFANATDGFVCGDLNTVLKTTNGGANWSTITTATIGTSLNFKDVYFANPSTGWLLANIGVVLRTTDAGATWSPGNTSSITPGGTWDKMHFADATNGYITGVANFSVLIAKTNDGGATWTNVPFTTSVSAITGIQALGNNSVMVAADNKVYYSANSGTTWSVSSAITSTSSNLGELKAFDFSNAYATNRTNGNSIVYRSNLFPTWNTSTAGLSGGGYNNIDAFDNNNVMISNLNSGNIFKTNNGGTSWTQETLPATLLVNDLKYISASAAWIVGSGGTILAYSSSVTPTSLNNNKNSNQLIALYPNPAQNFVTIKNVADNKLVEVINTLGQVILKQNISNERLNISHLQKGIYFVKIDDSLVKFIKE